MPNKCSNNMKYVKCKDTKIEVKLRLALWHAGIRYRKNVKDIEGKPDIVIDKYRIAIFCDGDFWHGYNVNRSRIHKNKNFWIDKIKRNMRRDDNVTKNLEAANWHVVRFWEHEINKDIKSCVRYIQEIIDDIEYNNYEV